MGNVVLLAFTGLGVGYALWAWWHGYKVSVLLALLIACVAATALSFHVHAWGLFGVCLILTSVGVYKTWRDVAWLPLYLVSFVIALLSFFIAIGWLPKY